MTRIARYILTFVIFSGCVWAQTTLGGASYVGGVTQLGGITTGGGVGCGTDCGYVGDPYEGVTFDPAGKTPLAACNTSLSPNTYYYLTQDISAADASTECLRMNYDDGNWSTLDLRSHTVTGYITLWYIWGATPAALTVFNGTVTCNVDWSATGRACVTIRAAGQPTGQTRVHHLTVSSTNTSNGSIAVNLTNEASHTPLTFPGHGLGLEARMDHISVTSPPCPTSRFGALEISDYVAVETDHNYVHCIGTTSACQGFPFLATTFVQAHHNQVEMDYNTVGDGRAFLCDFAGLGPGNTCDVYSNYIIATNNRAIRYRGPTSPVQYGKAYSNAIYNIQEGGLSAAIHIGEDDLDMEMADIEVYNNTFELNSTGHGQAVIVTWAQGPNIHDNTVTCYNNDCSSAGYFARTSAQSTAWWNGYAYLLNQMHVDPSGYTQLVTTAGTSGASEPAWNPVLYGTTSDGGAVWTNQGVLQAAIMTVKNTTFPGNWGTNKAIGVCGTGGALACYGGTQVSTATYCNTGTLDVGTGATATESCP